VNFLFSKPYQKIIALCFAILGILVLNKQIANFKDVDRLSAKIQALSDIESFNLARANPSQFPFRLGELKKNKSAYFLVDFEFIGKYVSGHENLFQSAPNNFGIRLEQSGRSLALIFSNYTGKEKYSVVQLTNALQVGQLHHVKIEALTKEFIRVDFDGKETLIQSPDIIFSTEEFLIGSGFDSSRNYSGELMNISFKKINYHSLIGSALRNYPRDISGLLTLIGKGGIFLALVLFFIFKKQRKFLFDPLLLSRKWIFILLAIQAIVIYGNPSYRYALIVYSYLLLIGFYPAKFFNSEFLKVHKYLWLFGPLIGFMILSLVGAYTIAFNYSVNTLFLLPAIFFVPVALMRCIKLRSDKAIIHFQQNLLHVFYGGLFYLTVIVAPLALILTSPSSYDGVWNFVASTPIRVGPDAALYARMAQFLLDGGTWATANLAGPDFIGMKVGEITKYTNATMDWPFLYFYRWGLVTFQSLYVTLNGLDHIYRVAFTSMLIPQLFLGGIIFYWLKEYFSLSLIASIAGSIGIIFNANLLNLWYEGFYGNSYSLCLYAFLYLLVAQAQLWKFDKSPDSLKQYFLVSLVLASILVSYGEGLLFVFIPLMGIYLLADLFVRKKINFKLFTMLLGCLVIAIVIVLPCQFIYDWLVISVKQITEEGGNGYPQPYWAALNEILGLNNIYEGINGFNGGNAFERSRLGIIVAALSSALIGLILLLDIKSDKNRYPYLLNISAYVLTAIFVIYIHKVSPLNNYGYMKMYIFLLPLLYVYFFKACYGVGQFPRFGADGHGNHIAIAICAVMVLNGVSYVVNYQKTSTLISPDHLLSHAKMKNLEVGDKVFSPVLKSKFPNTFPALIGAKWVTEAWEGKKIEDDSYFKNLLDRKAFLFIEKDGCDRLPDIRRNIFYEDNNFLILDTEKTVRSEIQDGYLKIDNFRRLKDVRVPKECTKRAKQ
jgi:hypothetical protein